MTGTVTPTTGTWYDSAEKKRGDGRITSTADVPVFPGRAMQTEHSRDSSAISLANRLGPDTLYVPRFQATSASGVTTLLS